MSTETDLEPDDARHNEKMKKKQESREKIMANKTRERGC